MAFVNRALYLRPLNSEAHRVAARSLLKLGKRKQALLEYRLAQQVSGAGQVLVEALGVARTPDELRSLISINPGEVRNLVEVLRSKGREADAESLITLTLPELEGQPGLSDLWLAVASIRAQASQLDSALAAVAEAERRDPEGLSPLLVRADFLGRQGKHLEATKLLQSKVSRHPSSVELAFALSAGLRAVGNHRDAREALLRINPLESEWLDDDLSLCQAPGVAGVVLPKAETLAGVTEGREGKALQSYQSAVRVLPSSPQLHYHVARVYERLGKYAEAIAAIHDGLRAEGRSDLGGMKPTLDRLGALDRQHRAAREERELTEGESPEKESPQDSD